MALDRVLLKGKSIAVVLCAALAACGAGDVEPEPPLPFDADLAWQDLVAQVKIGPRPAGSEGSKRTRELITQRMRQAGWVVTEQSFLARPPAEPPIAMTNVVATRDGEREPRIWLIAHYDTKDLEGVRFVGANDGASGVAVLLEVARGLSTRFLPYGMTMVFFDGEEARGPDITDSDGLYGSRWLAERMAREGTLDQIAALVLVDMVADRDLNLGVDLSSSPRLRNLLWQTARRLGLEDTIDRRQAFGLIDDHTPFVERGVSNALALIDFQYGARRSPGPIWHTPDDDLPAVSRDSLNTTGRLLVETLVEIERDLLRQESVRRSRTRPADPAGTAGGNGG